MYIYMNNMFTLRPRLTSLSTWAMLQAHILASSHCWTMLLSRDQLLARLGPIPVHPDTTVPKLALQIDIGCVHGQFLQHDIARHCVDQQNGKNRPCQDCHQVLHGKWTSHWLVKSPELCIKIATKFYMASGQAIGLSRVQSSVSRLPPSSTWQVDKPLACQESRALGTDIRWRFWITRQQLKSLYVYNDKV